MARMLVEYMVYDLDKQQITDFRLKPWVDRFLVLRASLYEDGNELTKSVNEDSDSEDSNKEISIENVDEQTDPRNEKFHLKDGTVSCPHGAFSPYPAQPLRKLLQGLFGCITAAHCQANIL